MKMKLNWSPVQFKPLLDHMEKMTVEDYNKVSPYFEVSHLKAGQVILQSGDTELESRFILEGMIGKFYKGKLKRFYVKDDICLEMESYSNQLPGKYELKVLQDATFTRLSYKNANLILKQYPEFDNLSDELYRMARNSEKEWEAILTLHYSEARKILNGKYPGFEAYISQKQLAGMLGVDPKTLRRRDTMELAKEKLVRVIKTYRHKLKYPFEAKLHPSVELLDNQTIIWGAIIHRIFYASREENVYKKKRLTWLSARLYPEASWNKLNWIARLYALLFSMDDFTDQLPDGMKGELWDEISLGISGVLTGENCHVLSKSVLSYRNAFYDLWSKFPILNEQDGKEYRDLIGEEIRNYLSSNLWEAVNRDQHLIPGLQEYRNRRPFFSGGSLAISLSPLGMDVSFDQVKEAYYNSKEIRSTAARLIYLTNDLFSFEKEKDLGDFHNLLILTMHHHQVSEQEARTRLLKEHHETLGYFLSLSKSLEQSENSVERELLRQIQFKVSGVVAWSLEDSSRYYKVLEESDKGVEPSKNKV